jgi:DNA (cytosine-5)-methyltransferase 1
MNLIDCFSGIGGFSLAARWVGGFTTVQFVEIDPYCQQVLRKHWPDVPIHDDIATFCPKQGAADVVVGGFPCQDISIAGKQAGIQESTRSGLFYQLMRVIRLVRPKFIVLENVAAILGNGLDTVLGELAAAGYDCEWSCIPASAVGACHQRDRWWAVAYPFRDGLERTQRIRSHQTAWLQTNLRCLNPTWKSYASQPVLCRGDDGLSHRVDRLKALGNAVVPQVAMIPLARVKELAQ